MTHQPLCKGKSPLALPVDLRIRTQWQQPLPAITRGHHPEPLARIDVAHVPLRLLVLLVRVGPTGNQLALDYDPARIPITAVRIALVAAPTSTHTAPVHALHIQAASSLWCFVGNDPRHSKI